MPDILYPGYRSYVASRVEVNDAMAALLAGSQLAAHTLSLTVGSSRTLSEIFPAVPHIRRLDLRTDNARRLLEHAEHHLASVALPYALATHEDFVTGVLDMLRTTNRTLVTGAKQVKAYNMHSILFDTAKVPEPAVWMEIFHLLRKVRNKVTHDGGSVDADLTATIRGMSLLSVQKWQQINRGNHPNALIVSGRLVLTAESVFTAFAATKRLGRAINAVLANELTRQEWSDIIVADFQASATQGKNSSSWRRALVGYGRHYYAAASVSETELEAAARAQGAWTAPSWHI